MMNSLSQDYNKIMLYSNKQANLKNRSMRAILMRWE